MELISMTAEEMFKELEMYKTNIYPANFICYEAISEEYGFRKRLGVQFKIRDGEFSIYRKIQDIRNTSDCYEYRGDYGAINLSKEETIKLSKAILKQIEELDVMPENEKPVCDAIGVL